MTPPLRPLPPAVRKAFAAYQKRPLDRLSDLAGLSRETGDAVQSFAMGATEPLDVKGALRAARRGIGALYHGSPNTALEVLASHPPARQYDNATSVFGGFATPDKAEAARYAGKAGRVYEVDGSLSNPHEMSWGEFGRFQAPHKAHDGSPLPPDAWAKRAEQLKQEAQALRKQLEAAGHDGIVVRDSRGNVKEQAFFRDTPMRDSLTVSGVRRGIEAWHGSPHKFDKFSLEKIGTGEGAQAYGHGLYFAESRPVAEMYRTQLAPDEITIGGKTVAEKMFHTTGTPRPPMTPEAEIALRWMETPNVEGVRRQLIESLTREAKIAPGSMRGEQMQKALALLDKGGDVSVKQGGGLYRVRLDVSPDELLDWDKPLAQQSDHVKQALKLGGPGTTASPDWTGSELYWGERAAFSPPQQAKGKAEADSKWLNRLGIPGIKYLDGGSRAAGDGTRNYVIFDPERIQILERLAALGLGGQMVKDMLAKAKAASASQQSQPPTLPPVTVRPPSTPRS